MKTKSKLHVLMMATIVAVFAAATWSCNKDDDPSLKQLREDKLAYLEDSLRISDSLRLLNNAGVVNYAIAVVDGSNSSIFNNGRAEKTQSAISGAIVTISQYGKTMTDTTDASGMVVFNGFFRSAATVSIEKTDYTSVSYISGVHVQDSTRTGTISFVGNLIPLFQKTGPNTATISGKLTIQTDLTNRVRENVPDGTTLSVAIDASAYTGSAFSDKFLTTDIDNEGMFTSSCGCQFVYVGNILQASYQTGVVGTTTAGNYTVTVPAAIDGLPLKIEYSDVAADQTLFIEDGFGSPIPGDRTAIVRTLFGPTISADFIPSGSTVDITFETETAAAGIPTAVISATAGTVDRVNVTATGAGYSGTPLLEILGGGGTGAAATATMVNGRITNINLTNPGSGYTSAPTVNILDGSSTAAASVTNLSQDGTVISVVITNSGSGYVTAPTVTFSAPTGTGLVAPVTAAGTANLSNGRVTSVTISNPGAAYIANPTVTFSAAPAGGVTATGNAFHSGQSISDVQVTNPGTEYSFAPLVTFSAPNIATGVRATGSAIINAVTRQVTGITITNAGMGYTAPPTVTLTAFTVAATAEIFLTGGSVVSVDIVGQGAGYTAPPTVTFTGGGGTGAAGTAVLVDGHIVGVNITNGGTGYTTPPTMAFESGSGASGFATVVNGVITAITISDGGKGYTGPPRVIVDDTGEGSGATATASVNAAGAITGVTMVTGGAGYLEGNTPNGGGVDFSSTRGNDIETKPGVKYANDAYYGTGDKQD